MAHKSAALYKAWQRAQGYTNEQAAGLIGLSVGVINKVRAGASISVASAKRFEKVTRIPWAEFNIG